MRDALRDAFGDWPTVGALRRGEQPAEASHGFDWYAVRDRVAEQHAAEIDRVLHPPATVANVHSWQASKRPNGGTNKRSYGIAVLDAECWRVARTPAGNRNNTLASASFKVGRRVGAGLLARNEAFANLLYAAIESGLAEREARPVIHSGLAAGARKALDAS